MKIQILFLYCSFFCFLQAPLCQAPDFTATDIQGNQHSLYADYLDQGKTVIIDFSATWCHPCWAAHETHALKDVYEMLGPDGTDQAMVLFVEGDEYTSVEELYQAGENSVGDWVTGTPYPIIDEGGAAIRDAYNIAYFPTIKLICPDGSIAAVDLWQGSEDDGETFNTQYVLNKVFECAGISSHNNDPRLLIATTKLEQDNCSTAHCEAWVHNNGQEAITTFELIVKFNGQPINNISWEGNLLPGRVDSIDLGYLNLPVGEEIYQYEVEMVATDDDDSNNSSTFSLHSLPAINNEITVEVQADFYATGDETRYTISNIAGEVLFESDVLESNELHVANYTLPGDGCYIFNMLDEYGDGNSGTILITDSNGVEAVDEVSSRGNSSLYPFNVGSTVSSTTTPSSIPLNFTLSPNPAVDGYTELHLQLASEDFVDIRLLNSMGQNIQSVFKGFISPESHKIPIDSSHLPKGNYWVCIQFSTGTATVPVLIQ